jgi:hypothetical protein
MSKSETPKSIEEALQGRPGMEPDEEIQEEPTLDETIQAVQREAQLQAQLTDQPMGTTTNTTTSPTLTNPMPEAALTESHRPVTVDSTPESVEAIKLLDPRPNHWPADMVRLAEYLAGPDFTINWVESQIRVLSTVPDIVPSPNQWKLPAEVDLPKLVFDIIRTPGWLSREWPSLRVLMGGSMGNIQWAAKVLVTLAIFQAVNLVGMFDGTQC